MASPHDEGESLPNSVSNYHLLNETNQPVSFSDLPLHWNNPNNDDIPYSRERKIFLHGTADIGLQIIHKQVIKWRFDISDAKPEVYLMLKETNKWVQVLKARKSFEDVIRSVLITVNILHFVRRLEAVGKAVWDHLSREFSSYETRPSENDLISHMALISEAVKRDETLAKSNFLVNFLEEKPCGKKSLDEIVNVLHRYVQDDDMVRILLQESSHPQEKADHHKSPVMDFPLDDHVLAGLVPSPVHD